MVTEARFTPDYATAPGEIIEEVLGARGINKVELATRSGLSTKTISLILSGKAPVTPDTAIQFERVLGISASIWNNLECNYRLFLAKAKDEKALEKEISWSEAFPLKEMVQKGWIPKGASTIENVSNLLYFFGVGSVPSWEQSYGNLGVRLRKSNKYPPTKEALAAWIRKCEIKANVVETDIFRREAMESALTTVRSLSCEEPEVFEPKMKQMLAKAGVALVFVPELSGTHLCGATKWLTPEKAMMALSLRYKTDDHLWFTFFHEAGHIKLHSKKLSFIDGEGKADEDIQETEADEFATEYLIPSKMYRKFISNNEFTASTIRQFSKELGIAPGIIVGRLQHDGKLNWSELNHLKCHFTLKE